MSLRPLPKLDDAAVMARLGRLSALRNARLDALHALRDSIVRLQGAQCDDLAEIASARACLDRLETVIALESAT
jgi:hypothetical protein